MMPMRAVVRGVIAGVALLSHLAAAPPTQAKTGRAAKPAPAASADKAPADIDALLAGLSKAPGLYAHFREEKHLTLMQQPLVSEGRLYFAPPSRFARHTDKPIASTLIIDGNQLQFGSADGQESMNLGTNPVARLFADAFVMLLSGNRAGLEKIFKMQLTPKVGGTSASGEWKLVLTPRVAPMDKLIKELELRGRGLSLNELDVREASGDWTRTSFSDVDLNRRYTAAEQTKFFTLPKK
jgi:outer membrane lipoprotein-sorting protein